MYVHNIFAYYLFKYLPTIFAYGRAYYSSVLIHPFIIYFFLKIKLL